MVPKKSWQERVRDTDKFHKRLVRLAHNEEKSHTIKDTAVLLNRSYGSVAEDLLLASWMLSHPQVADYKTAYEAIKFVRNKSREIRLRMLDGD